MHQLAREKKRGVLKSELALDYTQLTAAATSQVFLMPALPAGAVVLGAGIEVDTVLDDGSTGVFTGDIGIQGGAVDAFINGADLETAGAQGLPQGAQIGSLVGAITPQLTVDAGAVNVNTAIQGSIRAKVLYAIGG